MTRVGESVARQVGPELRLVVDLKVKNDIPLLAWLAWLAQRFEWTRHLVPDDGVGFSRGAGGSDGEDEPAVPCHQQQPQNLQTGRRKAASAEPPRFAMSNLEIL